jgi:hypothetical protein
VKQVKRETRTLAQIADVNDIKRKELNFLNLNCCTGIAVHRIGDGIECHKNQKELNRSYPTSQYRKFKRNDTMYGAYFSKMFHKSAPRNSAAVQRVRQPKDMSNSATKRSVGTSSDNSKPPEEVRKELWDAYGLDEGWGPWFLVP